MKSLNDYTDTLTSKLFAENGAFFAFGQKQFDEKKKAGVTYVDLGAGLLCPKINASRVVTQFEAIFNEAVKKQVEEFGAEKIIRYEYFNHETQITGDVDQVKNVLSTHKELFPELFSDEVVVAVCRKCFDEAVENDWF